jgi:hypothetical protein
MVFCRFRHAPHGFELVLESKQDTWECVRFLLEEKYHKISTRNARRKLPILEYITAYFEKASHFNASRDLSAEILAGEIVDDKDSLVLVRKPYYSLSYSFDVTKPCQYKKNYELVVPASIQLKRLMARCESEEEKLQCLAQFEGKSDGKMTLHPAETRLPSARPRKRRHVAHGLMRSDLRIAVTPEEIDAAMITQAGELVIPKDWSPGQTVDLVPDEADIPPRIRPVDSAS